MPGTQKIVTNYAHCDKQGRSRSLEKGVCREPEDMASSDSAWHLPGGEATHRYSNFYLHVRLHRSLDRHPIELTKPKP